MIPQQRPNPKEKNQDANPKITDLIDDYIEDEDALTLRNGHQINSSGFKGKGEVDVSELNPSVLSSPLKDEPRGSLIPSKMKGCINSRNE
jgi:hypothetical protein